MLREAIQIENRGEQDMEKLITIYNTEYAIPAVFSYSQKHEKMPAVILCHGTGSQKNEVGNLFAEMSKRLLNIGIASIRLDYTKPEMLKRSGRTKIQPAPNPGNR